jgi:hypothetical protein
LKTALQAPFSFLSSFLKPACKGRMGATLTQSTMKNLTRYLGLAAKLLVFLLVLGFALKNSHTTIFYLIWATSGRRR